jgi:hypothetical protein
MPAGSASGPITQRPPCCSPANHQRHRNRLLQHELPLTIKIAAAFDDWIENLFFSSEDKYL